MFRIRMDITSLVVISNNEVPLKILLMTEGTFIMRLVVNRDKVER